MFNSEERRRRQAAAADGDEELPLKTLLPPSPAPSSSRTLLEQAADSVPTFGFLGLRRISRIEEVGKDEMEEKIEPGEPEDP